MKPNKAPSLGLRPTWFEIDIDAISHNVRELRRLTGAGIAIYVCLKRNAYGCGVVPVARVSMENGADGLAVGNINDGVAVRQAGIAGALLLYPTCLPDAAPAVEAYDFIPTISTPEEAAAWNAALTQSRPVFLKVDVGLFRAGAMPKDAAGLFQAVRDMPRLHIKGLYSHFFGYGAKPTPEHYAWQYANMKSALAAAADAGVTPPITMVSATSSVLDFPDMDLTGVDPGRVIYGIGQLSTPQRPADFRRAFVAFKTRLLMRKSLEAAETGGFPTPFALRPGMTIGVLPIGWGDGLPRKLPDNAVALIHGRKAPLLNPIHLEHLRIDLTGIPEAQPGDEVVLIGRQGDEELSINDVTETWGIDSTTFHAQMRDHIHREYLKSDGHLAAE